MVGPPGSGRRTLARWLSLEVAAHGGCESLRDAPFFERVALPVDALDATRGPRMDAERADFAALLVTGLERVDRATQVGLWEHWTERLRRPVWALLPRLPSALVEEGGLAPEIGARLALDRFVLPPLARSRARLPVLAAHLLRRIAARDGLPCMALSDAALAALWRADWPCNALDLEAVLEHAARTERRAERPGAAHPGRPAACVIAVATIEAALRSCGLEPVPRRPSRHPAPQELAAAVWCTRTAGGRVNKARAASWLGWDSATLGARLHVLGLNSVEGARRLLAREGVFGLGIERGSLPAPLG
ncbi:MAG: hypothetical protein R3F49_23600 [Planctomycetota bacterium]